MPEPRTAAEWAGRIVQELDAWASNSKYTLPTFVLDGLEAAIFRALQAYDRHAANKEEA